MIEYLLYAYKREVRNKNIRKLNTLKKYEIALVVFLIIIAIMIPVFSFFFKNMLGAVICTVILFAVVLFLSVYLEYDMTKRYEAYVERYNEKLDAMRIVLKKEMFSAYSKKTIEGLINQCNDQLPRFERSSVVFKPIKTVVATLIIPLISISVASYLENITSKEIMIFVSGIIAIIIAFLIIYYSVAPIISNVINQKYIILYELKQVLVDILIFDFS